MIKLFSRISLFLCFVLITDIAEKVASHKYVEAKGSSDSKAFCPRSGCSCFTHTQNLCECGCVKLYPEATVR